MGNDGSICISETELNLISGWKYVNFGEFVCNSPFSYENANNTTGNSLNEIDEVDYGISAMVVESTGMFDDHGIFYPDEVQHSENDEIRSRSDSQSSFSLIQFGEFICSDPVESKEFMMSPEQLKQRKRRQSKDQT